MAANERKRVTRSFLLIVAISAVLVSWSGYNSKRGHDLAMENQARLQENVVIRKELVAGFKRTSFNQCRQIKTLNGGFRRAALRRYNMLDQTLALLHIEKTPEIEQAALNQLNDTLFRYKDVQCNFDQQGQ